MKRPDLTGINPDIKRYIEYLEAKIYLPDSSSERVKRGINAQVKDQELSILDLSDIVEPPEAPTTMCVITATASGIGKRTARHLYSLQHRGGMGIFDLETHEDQPPTILTIADQNQNLLLITNTGKAYRLAAQAIPESPVRSRGASIITKFNLPKEERISAILPEQAQGYLALLGQNGMVRMLRHHIFGEYMKPGIALYEFRTFGFLASATWTPGDGDLLIASQQGRAIRFTEKLVPPQGTQGIRLAENDKAVSIAAVYPDSDVFMLGADGRGTIRSMDGFAPNKAPGSSGKIAMATEKLVIALKVEKSDEIFIISALSKIIRFRVNEIPQKDGIVQGVVCINLRADEPIAATINPTS
jgi:DNA gyrase subunit A